MNYEAQGARSKLRIYYDTNLIDNDTFKQCEVESREELQAMAEEEGIYINWEAWDRVVQETRKHIEEDLKTFERKERITPIYVYDNNTSEFLGYYQSASSCGRVYGMPPAQVIYHAKRQVPINDVFFSIEEIDKVPIKEDNTKWVYVYDLHTNELKGKYRTQTEAARAYNLRDTAVGYTIKAQGGKYHKQGLRFTYQEPNEDNQYEAT